MKLTYVKGIYTGGSYWNFMGKVDGQWFMAYIDGSGEFGAFHHKESYWKNWNLFSDHPEREMEYVTKTLAPEEAKELLREIAEKFRVSKNRFNRDAAQVIEDSLTV